MTSYSVSIGLFPDGGQRDVMSRQLSECRTLYNSLSNVCKTCLIRRTPLPGQGLLEAMAVGMMPDSDIDGSVLEDVGDRVSNAYALYERKIAERGKSGLPRFKTDSRYRSMTFGPGTYALGGDAIGLPGIGDVKMGECRICRDSGVQDGPGLNCRVHIKGNGTWYARFMFDMEWLSGLESHAEWEWEVIDRETALRILDTAARIGDGGRAYGAGTVMRWPDGCSRAP